MALNTTEELISNTEVVDASEEELEASENESRIDYGSEKSISLILYSITVFLMLTYIVIGS